MRDAPNPSVVAWLDAQDANELFIPSLALAEIHYGIAVLPASARRRLLEASIADLASRLFSGRILAFGERAAVAFGKVAATRRSLGRPISRMDALIAALALSSGATLATRNARDFEGIRLELVNPFDYAP